MLTGTLLLVTRSERITELNIDGLIGFPDENREHNPSERNETYADFRRQIEAIRNISTPEIVVNIRSSGGSVDDALLIHDILRESGKQVTTRCYGYVASAATLIAQAASKGRREMSANGLYLIHRSITSGAGNAGMLEQTVDLLNQTDRRIAALYAARSGKTADHFARLMDLNQGNGKWLCAREAKSAGLIDRIIPAQSISNEARQTLRTLNLPALPALPDANQPDRSLQRLFKRLWETIGGSPGDQGKEIVISVKPATEAADSPRPKSEAEKAEISNAAPASAPPQAVKPQASLPDDPPLRLKALATPTEAKEDPAQDEPLLSPNARAYKQDIEQLTL